MMKNKRELKELSHHLPRRNLQKWLNFLLSSTISKSFSKAVTVQIGRSVLKQ